jgi:hypothetical protein
MRGKNRQRKNRKYERKTKRGGKEEGKIKLICVSLFNSFKTPKKQEKHDRINS